eukprot:6477498-Amphidinium_carterae.1
MHHCILKEGAQRNTRSALHSSKRGWDHGHCLFNLRANSGCRMGLGLTSAQMQAIQRTSRMHDFGKVTQEQSMRSNLCGEHNSFLLKVLRWRSYAGTGPAGCRGPPTA